MRKRDLRIFLKSVISDSVEETRASGARVARAYGVRVSNQSGRVQKAFVRERAIIFSEVSYRSIVRSRTRMFVVRERESRESRYYKGQSAREKALSSFLVVLHFRKSAPATRDSSGSAAVPCDFVFCSTRRTRQPSRLVAPTASFFFFCLPPYFTLVFFKLINSVSVTVVFRANYLQCTTSCNLPALNFLRRLSGTCARSASSSASILFISDLSSVFVGENQRREKKLQKKKRNEFARNERLEFRVTKQTTDFFDQTS